MIWQQWWHHLVNQKEKKLGLLIQWAYSKTNHVLVSLRKKNKELKIQLGHKHLWSTIEWNDQARVLVYSCWDPFNLFLLYCSLCSALTRDDTQRRLIQNPSETCCFWKALSLIDWWLLPFLFCCCLKPNLRRSLDPLNKYPAGVSMSAQQGHFNLFLLITSYLLVSSSFSLFL